MYFSLCNFSFSPPNFWWTHQLDTWIPKFLLSTGSQPKPSKILHPPSAATTRTGYRLDTGCICGYNTLFRLLGKAYPASNIFHPPPASKATLLTGYQLDTKWIRQIPNTWGRASILRVFGGQVGARKRPCPLCSVGIYFGWCMVRSAQDILYLARASQKQYPTTVSKWYPFGI
jgi:hypothetical protein